MSEIKVRLNMKVPGAQMLSSQDCEKMSTNEAYDNNSLSIAYKVKTGNKTKIKREIISFNTRKSIPCRQNLCISTEAYNYMVSTEIPGNFPSNSKRKWFTMTKKQRLEWHLNNIAEGLNAESFTYDVLDN